MEGKKLRPYQIELSEQGIDKLREFGLVYLSMQVRSGKTLTSLEICKLYGSKKVLFITKKKAISSIQNDYDKFGYLFDLTVINKESIHKIIGNDFDVVILDESHQYGSFPKPSKYQKDIKLRFGSKPIIFLSGTMSPESYSQAFNQLNISSNSPFKEYRNFYRWAKDYVNVKQKNLGYATVNDYSDANFDSIYDKIKHIIISFTQEQAGFKSSVKEHILSVRMKDITYKIINKLKKDRIYIGNSDSITADTAVKLQQKIHQLSGGSVILDSGKYAIIDTSKAEFVNNNFKDKKIAIFYKFKSELSILKSVIGERLTDSLDEFNTIDYKWIAYQFISGREGTNLSKADYIVMYSIDFSSVSYQQSKDRMTTMDRKENTIYWIFGEKTLDKLIYDRVLNKKNFTTSVFLKSFINA